jgi:AraC-like DNA-binding protein
MEMNEYRTIDFLQVAPYVRFVHFFDAPDSWIQKPRIIYDHELIFVKEGRCMCRIENIETEIKTGDLLLMRPYVEHSMWLPENAGFQCYAVHFDFLYPGEMFDFSPYDVYLKQDPRSSLAAEGEPRMRPIIELGEIDIPYIFPSQQAYRFSAGFGRLTDLFQDRSFGSHVRLRAAMLDIIGLIIGELSTEEGVSQVHPHKDKIVDVIKTMQERYHEELDLNKLAAACLLSPKYFRSLFKQATGKSAGEFLTDIRMEKAKQLLMERKHSVQEVARMVGFEDFFYFSKIFKKTEGLSPKFYMESIGRTLD